MKGTGHEGELVKRDLMSEAPNLLVASRLVQALSNTQILTIMVEQGVQRLLEVL